MEQPIVPLDFTLLAPLQVFKWNEKLSHNNLPPEKGLFLFRIHDRDISHQTGGNGNAAAAATFKSRVKYNVQEFSLGELVSENMSEDEILCCLVRACGIFTNLQEARMLAQDIDSQIKAGYCFTQTMLSAGVDSSRVVIVVDVHRGFFHDEEQPAVPPGFEQVLNTSINVTDCGSMQEVYLSLFATSDRPLDDSSDEDDDAEIKVHETAGDLEETGSSSGHEDETYNDEKEMIARVLRSWRGVDRTDPLVCLTDSDPIGLVEMEPNVMTGKLKRSKPDEKDDNDDDSKRKKRRFVSIEKEDSCAICLEGFEEGMYVTNTKCRHTFHWRCMGIWLLKKDTCPICRADTRIFI